MDLNDKILRKMAKVAFVPQGASGGQVPPPDPAAGGAPADPMAAMGPEMPPPPGGMPPGGMPMDPMAGGDPAAGGIPMDPAAMMDPAAAGGDPAAAGGLPPMDDLLAEMGAEGEEPIPGEEPAPDDPAGQEEAAEATGDPSDTINRGQADVVLDIAERTLAAHGLGQTQDQQNEEAKFDHEKDMAKANAKGEKTDEQAAMEPGPVTGLPPGPEAEAGGVSGLPSLPKIACEDGTGERLLTVDDLFD